MRKQGRFVSGRRRHVSANQPEMRRTMSVGARPASDEIIHPGSTAFRFARMPVGVKRAEVLALAIVEVEKFNFGMPDLDCTGCTLDDFESENTFRDFEKPGEHARHREIWAQLLLVKIVAFLPQFFGPVAKLPRRKRRNGSPRALSLELLQLTTLLGESLGGAMLQVLQKFPCAFASFGHAPLQSETGKMRPPEQRRFLRPQRQNPRY